MAAALKLPSARPGGSAGKASRRCFAGRRGGREGSQGVACSLLLTLLQCAVAMVCWVLLIQWWGGQGVAQASEQASGRAAAAERRWGRRHRSGSHTKLRVRGEMMGCFWSDVGPNGGFWRQTRHLAEPLWPSGVCTTCDAAPANFMTRFCKIRMSRMRASTPCSRHFWGAPMPGPAPPACSDPACSIATSPSRKQECSQGPATDPADDSPQLQPPAAAGSGPDRLPRCRGSDQG